MPSFGSTGSHLMRNWESAQNGIDALLARREERREPQTWMGLKVGVLDSPTVRSVTPQLQAEVGLREAQLRRRQARPGELSSRTSKQPGPGSSGATVVDLQKLKSWAS